MKTIVKNFVLALTLLAMLTGFAMGDVIASQSFESDLTGYSHTPSQTPATDPGDQYFYRAEPSDGSIYEAVSDGPYSNVTGSWLFVGSNPNTINGGSPGVITFDVIDVTGYSNLTFSADWGACPLDWDAADELKVEYSWDNSSWSTLYYFQVDPGSDGTNEPLQVAGNATGGDNTANGTVLTYALTSVVSTNFTGSGNSLYLKITCNSGANYEAFGVDNIVVSGTAAGGVADPTGFSSTVASSSQINLTWTQNDNTDNVMVVYDEDGSFTDPTDGVSYSVSSSACGGTVIFNGSGTSYNHSSLSANTSYYYKAWSVDGSDNYSSGVTANATTYKIEPSNHAASFAASGVSYNLMSVDWADNDGAQAADGFLVKASSTSLEAITAPSDGTAESDDTNLGDGSAVVNIAHGTQTYQFTGLDGETTYYFKIWPYTNSGTAIDYKTDGSIPEVSQATTTAPTAPNLIISEVADPSDAANAKFLELYNATGDAIDLSAGSWYIGRQSNGDSWADVALTGTIASHGTYVIAYSQTTFDATYNPLTADQYSGTISSNGDDGYFLYMNGDHITGFLVDAYGVIDQDGTGYDWEFLDARAYRNADIGTPNDTWTASEWTVAASATAAECTPGTHSYEVPTPITLTTFTAIAKNGTVELAWETASEVNNARFVIYRNNEAIASLQGAGTSSKTNSYSYVDANVVPGVAYTYVLADVDYANTETKYENKAQTVILENDIVEADFVVGNAYPNPFNPATVVPFELAREAHVKASLYDLYGREIEKLVNTSYPAGSHELYINAMHMSSGIYFIQFEIENMIDLQKISLIK